MNLESNLFFVYNTTLTSKSDLKLHSLPSELIFCGIFPLNDGDRGEPRRDAFLIAVDEINSQVGENRLLPENVTIKPVFFNDNNTWDGGGHAANECVNSNASVVIGASASHSSINAAIQLTPHEIVQISYASTAPWLSDRTLFPYFMRTVESDFDESNIMNELISAFQWKNGGIIYSNSSLNTNPYMGIAEQFLNTTQIEINTVQKFYPGEINYTSQIQEINDSKPEVVFVVGHDPDTDEIYKEAYKQNLTNRNEIAWVSLSKIHPGPIFTSNDSILKEAKQNIIQISPPIFQGPHSGKFQNLWKSTIKCGLNLNDGPVEPCAFNRSVAQIERYSPVVYDTVHITARGFSSAAMSNPLFTGNDASFLLEHLYQVIHEGAGSSYQFDENGEVEGPYHVLNLNGDIYNLVAVWEGKLSFKSENIILPGNVGWTVSENRLICKINCPYSVNNDFITILILLLLTMFLGGLLYLRKYRQKYSFKKWIETSRITHLREFHKKIIIGLENAQIALLTKNLDLPEIEAINDNTGSTSTVVGQIFPPNYRNDLQSSIRGRTVLILIEFAYQELENSHPSYIAKSLNLPRTSVFNEIKQLLKLEYIQSTISPKTLEDSRFKYYSLSRKGIVFLYLLKETLNITIMQMQKDK
jgi:DNA-binding MarR family transcriptional regulator